MAVEQYYRLHLKWFPLDWTGLDFLAKWRTNSAQRKQNGTIHCFLWLPFPGNSVASEPVPLLLFVSSYYQDLRQFETSMISTRSLSNKTCLLINKNRCCSALSYHSDWVIDKVIEFWERVTVCETNHRFTFYTFIVRHNSVSAFVHLMAVWLQLWNFHWILPLCSPANFASSVAFFFLQHLWEERKRGKKYPRVKINSLSQLI